MNTSQPQSPPPSTLERLIIQIGQLGYRRPWLIICLALIAAAAGGWGILQLTIDPDLKALLPSDHPSVSRLETLQQRIGGQSDLIVEIRSPDREANIAFGRALVERMEKIPELRYALFHRDLSFFKDNALLYLPLRDLLDLRQKIIRRIREEVRSQVVEDLEGPDDAEEAGPATGETEKEDILRMEVDEVFASYFRGAEAPSEYMEVDQGRVMVIKARPTKQTTDVKFSALVVAKVGKAIDALDPRRFHPQLTARVAGEYQERAAQSQGVRADVLASVAGAVALLFFIVAAYFRSLRHALIVFIPVLVASLITLGTGALLYQTFNLVTAFIFAILLGLGIDYAIHCSARYLFERSRGLSATEALQMSYRTTGLSLLTSAATTAVVFFSLVLGTFRGFSQLGVVAGIGILFAVSVTLLLTPALFTASERIWPLRLRTHRVRRQGEGRPWVRTAWVIVLLCTILGALSFWSMPHIGFEYDFTKLGNKRSPAPASSGKPTANYKDAIGRVTTFAPALALCATQADCAQIADLLRLIRHLGDHEMSQIFGPSAAPNNKKKDDGDKDDKDDEDDDYGAEDDDLLPPDPFQDLEAALAGGHLLPEERARLAPLGRPRLDEMRYFLQATLGLHLFIPAHQRQKLTLIQDIRRRIDAKMALFSDETQAKIDQWHKLLEVTRAITQRELPSWVLHQLEERDGQVGRFIILWNRGSKADYADAKRLYKYFFDLPIEGKTVPVAASYFVLVEVIDVLKAEGPWVVLVAFAAVFFCLLLFERSLTAVLLIICPLVLSIAWLGGVYFVMGWKLNMFSIVAFPLLIGMGIDHSIHVHHRWRESPSMGTVLREVGGPIFTCTLTTFIGFASLLLAKHVGIRSLGITAGLGMWLTLIGTVFFLPALLYLLHRRRQGINRT